MKKLVCLLLVMLMMFGLAACDSVEDPGVGTPSSTITRTVLVDEADVKIVALSLAEQTMVGPELKLQIENKTDKDLVFQSRNTAVNHYVVDSIMSVEVKAGEKKKCSMILSNTDMQACGITTIARVEIAFRAFDATDWKQYLNTQPVTLETTAAKGFDYTTQHEGIEAHADNGVKIVIKEPVKQSGVQVYIYNGSEGAVSVQTADCNINGMQIDPQFYEEIPVGKHLVTEIVFAEELLEENNITAVTDFDVVFQILNDVGEVITDTEKVSVKIQ